VSTLAFLQPADGESAMAPRPLDLIVYAYGVFSAAVSAVSTHAYMPHTYITSGCHSEWSPCFSRIDPDHKQNGLQRLGSETLSSNVHIGLHLPEFAVEYGHLTNTTSLAGEKKHKNWKAYVDRASPANLMAYLFTKDRLRQSLRLALAGAWINSYPDIIRRLSSIQGNCPTLMDKYISSNEDGLLDLQ